MTASQSPDIARGPEATDMESLRTFLAATDHLFKQTCGVSYLTLVREGGLENFQALAQSCRSQEPPHTFLERTIARYGLIRVGELDQKDARDHNMRKAAIAEYVRTGGDGWQLGADGSAYRENDGNVERLEVVRNDDLWGWQVVWAEAPEIGLQKLPDGRVCPPEVEFKHGGAAIDIGDAIDKWSLQCELSPSTSFSR